MNNFKCLSLASAEQGDTSGQALAFVDFHLTPSGVCPTLLGQLQIWQDWHNSLATFWNSKNLCQQKLGSDVSPSR